MIKRPLGDNSRPSGFTIEPKAEKPKYSMFSFLPGAIKQVERFFGGAAGVASCVYKGVMCLAKGAVPLCSVDICFKTSVKLLEGQL